MTSEGLVPLLRDPSFLALAANLGPALLLL